MGAAAARLHESASEPHRSVHRRFDFVATLLFVSFSVFWPTALAAHRPSDGFALSLPRWRRPAEAI
jgi:hypothetical protein